MPLPFSIGFKVSWLSVLLYWLWTARRVKAIEKTEPPLKRFCVYWLPFFVALLLGPADLGPLPLHKQFLPHTTFVYSIGLALCIFGAALAIWSRYLLGQNWSGTVQIKQGHELIQLGPYRLVRHPIYSGLLLLFIGGAIMIGDWGGVLAVVVFFASLWRKLRLEERWLSECFGDTYDAYKLHTKALIPAVF